MMTFDGVGREVCVARRIRTNTPLQALVTLNDSVYLEASRHLAFRMQAESSTGKSVAEQIQKGYYLMFYKPLQAGKQRALENLYQTAYKTYQSDKEKQCEMVGVNDAHNTPETAALVVVANALLNLDETVMKN
jgi:16S rRNA U516 pseudouridylate synthase RsuA-like enzyme